MTWLRQHAWWGLLAVSVLLVVFGVTDVASGATADVGIPQGLTGRTIGELEAESPDAYGMFDFMTRVSGWSLIIIGLLLSVIILIPFRGGERWAWWTMWVLPVWAVGAAAFYLVAGVQPDQAPPPPMISGPALAAFCAAILLITEPRFGDR